MGVVMTRSVLAAGSFLRWRRIDEGAEKDALRNLVVCCGSGVWLFASGFFA